jgi:hypothetical protein
MTVSSHTGRTGRTIGRTHNQYRRYIRYKCNRPVGGVGAYATEMLHATGANCLTGKVCHVAAAGNGVCGLLAASKKEAASTRGLVSAGINGRSHGWLRWPN